jgi:hypothetical protein
MFQLAAETWDKENCGCNEIVNVSSGAEAVEAMEAYAKKNGGIDGLRIFSHSGNQGLYFDTSGTYASLYSGGPGWLYSFLPFNNAARLSDIDPSWFTEDASVQILGCKSAKGKNSFAELFSKHIGKPVTGSQSGNSFSGVKDGKPGEGLPQIVPYNYSPIYLVPEGSGWKTFSGK